MKSTVIKVGTEKEFFSRGRKIAKLADRGLPIPEERVLSFEDPADLLKLLTPARLKLLETITKHPGSIKDVADRVSRDRSAVSRDVSEMEKAGLVQIESKVLPGHGRMKEVRATAKRLKLEAQFSY